MGLGVGVLVGVGWGVTDDCDGADASPVSPQAALHRWNIPAHVLQHRYPTRETRFGSLFLFFAVCLLVSVLLKSSEGGFKSGCGPSKILL